MQMLELIAILVPLVLFNVDVGAVDVTSLPPCNFPAIYNFGDSNSAAFGKNPDGGRLLIEYMADYLKLPYVSAYPNSSETKFQYGANFASSGASIRPQHHHPGANSFHLKIQVQQFGDLKARSSSNQGTNGLFKPEDFSKALYTLDIGQNDLTISYQQKLDVRAQIPDVINQFTTAVKDLYELGARAFWIHNTAPFGCLPYAKLLVNDIPIPKTQDQHECNTFMNEMSKEYNRQLHETVKKLRVELPNAALTYVDLNTPMYELLTAYTKLGIQKATYDGVHRTQSASLWLSNWVVNGSLSEPPIPINYACRKHVGS